MATTARKFGVEAFENAFDSAALPAVTAERKAALERFAETGLPHHKIEAWKYTSLVHLARTAFQPAPANFELAGDLPERLEGAARVVFVNGRYSEALSDPRVAGHTSLKFTASSDAFVLGREVGDDPMLALSAALAADGAVLTFSGDQPPVELLYVTVPGAAPQMAHTRNRIEVTSGTATVVERHVTVGSGETTLNNGATQIALAEGATFQHIKLQDEALNANHIWHHTVGIPAGARYHNYVISVGGGLARNRITARLLGEGADCVLDGAYAARGRQHLDHTSLIDHAVADCTSRQVYKGVIDNEARGVFQGHIIVREDAQRTDGHQLNRALMLSDKAEIDSKPMLEIYADDVKCSHGATAGDLDEDHVFYLQSRGIPAPEARQLLVEAFLAETLEAVPFEPAREAAIALIQEHLAR